MIVLTLFLFLFKQNNGIHNPYCLLNIEAGFDLCNSTEVFFTSTSNSTNTNGFLDHASYKFTSNYYSDVAYITGYGEYSSATSFEYDYIDTDHFDPNYVMKNNGGIPLTSLAISYTGCNYDYCNQSTNLNSSINIINMSNVISGASLTFQLIYSILDLNDINITKCGSNVTNLIGSIFVPEFTQAVKDVLQVSPYIATNGPYAECVVSYYDATKLKTVYNNYNNFSSLNGIAREIFETYLMDCDIVDYNDNNLLTFGFNGILLCGGTICQDAGILAATTIPDDKNNSNYYNIYGVIFIVHFVVIWFFV